MKTLLTCAAGALLLLSIPAVAQNPKSDGKTLEPNEITVAKDKQTLQLSDQQRAVIQEALDAENTQQKTPPNYQPKVGDVLPGTMTVDVMPARLVEREPSLQPYGYAKLAKDLLVIDPMKKTIIAVMPRKTPSLAKDELPADWAATRGRELTGKAPEPKASVEPQMEPAGDTGDKTNGNEMKTKENQEQK